MKPKKLILMFLTYFLQVLDDGRLTDGQGRTVDFRNTVVIMTSNIGSEIIQTYSDDSQYVAMKAQVMTELGNHFKPEFINRVDETVVFHPLLVEQIERNCRYSNTIISP